MNRLLVVLAALLALASPALADNPRPAQWQGTRTTGHGVQFFNSGNGVTLQDATAGLVSFPLGVNAGGVGTTTSLYNIGTGGTRDTIPLLHGLFSSVTGSYTSASHTGIWSNFINNFNVTRAGAAAIRNTYLYTGVGGTSQTGGFINFDSTVDINVATADTTQSFYQAGNFATQAEVDVGGAPGTPLGSLFGLGVYATLNSGAANWRGLVGQEIDITAASGSGLEFLAGLSVVVASGNQAVPSLESDGIAIGAGSNAAGTATLTCGICFTGYNGFNALASGASILKLFPHGGSGSYPQASITDGIDLHLFAFSGKAFRGANDTFTVDGSGNVVGLSYTGTGTTLTLTGTGAGTQTIVLGDTAAHDAVEIIEAAAGTPTIRGIGVTANRDINLEAAGNGVVWLGNVTDGLGMRIIDSGGATVNILTVTPAQTGGTVALTFGGPSADTNVNAAITTKGTGEVRFLSDNGGTAVQFKVIRTASPVDYLTVTGSATGSPGTPTMSVAGTDTDISINLAPKGAGVIDIGGTPGVSCGAGTVNLTTEVVTKGIVTHC